MQIDFGIVAGFMCGFNLFNEDTDEGVEYNVQLFLGVLCIHLSWVGSSTY
jgi:hypothetical protein